MAFLYQYMRSRLRFLFLYFLFWLVFFQVARLAFVIYHWKNTSKLSFADALLSFLYGSKMDISLTAYILIPVCIFLLLSVWFNFFKKRIIYFVYTSVTAIVLLIIIAADLELYGHWGFRIDDTPLKYLSGPREVWASVSHLPLFLIGIGLLAAACLLIYVIRTLLRRIIAFHDDRPRRFFTSLVLAALFPVLIIAIRGGLQLTPMNQSAVYFSKNNFANIAAINAAWNFMHGVTSNSSRSDKEYQYFNEEEMQNIVDSLYRTQNGPYNYFNGKKPNIIFVIWESFTEKAIHLQVNGKEVAPGFNKLRQEGLYFSNTYASGDRTDKGLSAILSGYPALNRSSVIRTPSKVPSLSFLSKMLKEVGYNTSFYYGGETEFANIKSYLYQSGFDRITDKNSFSRQQQNSKWGAHDGVVFGQIRNDLLQFKSPFFLTWLTLTSHEPYEVPEGFEGIPGSDPTSRFLNSIHYTDKVVNDFVSFCKKQSWWNETILVIVGDHGHILPEGKDRADDFRIPMLWLGGAVDQKGTVEKVVSQLDIGNTITSGLGISPLSSFSRNLFDSNSLRWAFFTYNNAFGFVQDSCSLVFDNTGKTIVHKTRTCASNTERAGKALQQRIHMDFLNK